MQPGVQLDSYASHHACQLISLISDTYHFNSLSLARSRSLSLSVSFCVCICLCLCPCALLFVCLSAPSLCLPACLVCLLLAGFFTCVRLVVYLCKFFCLSLCCSLSLCFSPSLSLSLLVSLSLCLSPRPSTSRPLCAPCPALQPPRCRHAWLWPGLSSASAALVRRAAGAMCDVGVSANVWSCSGDPSSRNHRPTRGWCWVPLAMKMVAKIWT